MHAFEWISVTGHSDEFYNGNYWSDGELWNGRLHLMSDTGAQLYSFVNEDGQSFFWNLDHRDQDLIFANFEDDYTLPDWHSGGRYSSSYATVDDFLQAEGLNALTADFV